jgi:DNA-binding CsgD family transcriptional regulator
VIDYCQRQAAYADRRGLLLLAAWARALQAAAHHAAGEHGQAAAGARAALGAPACARGGPRRLATVLATAVLAGCLAEQGEHQEGLAVLGGVQLDGDLPGLWVYDEVLRSRGRLRLAAGDWPGALADLLECGRRSEAGAAGDPVVAWWRPAAAVAYAALGRRTEAIALARQQVALARAAAVPGTLAEALAVHGVLARRRQPITEAAGILAEPSAAAPAEDPARLALDLLRGHGAGLLASQLERLVDPARRAPVGPGPAAKSPAAKRPAAERPAAGQGRRPAFGPSALTAHERRLIAMAVAGQTNDAIARHFGVSRRAVEFHFTHIYRKLGITRRPQLRAAALGDQGAIVVS